MSEQIGFFPRPGHAGDLHDWAKQQDRQGLEQTQELLHGAIGELRELFTKSLQVEDLSEEITKQFDFWVDNICRYSAATIEIRTSGLSTIYDGEAFNA